MVWFLPVKKKYITCVSYQYWYHEEGDIRFDLS